MLEIKDLYVSYGNVEVMHNVALSVDRGQIVSIIGSNGAGKSTLLNTISGIIKPKAGLIEFEGEKLPCVPHRVVEKGIIHVPESRRVFQGLTVDENLKIGAYSNKDKRRVKEICDEMYGTFPILKERCDQFAGTLSGGEQQMLAIARGLIADPKLLLLDEPSLGLAPKIVQDVFQIIEDIRSRGITVLLVEQNANKALEICDYAYVLENGRIVCDGTYEQLCKNYDIEQTYLGKKVGEK